MATSTEAVIIAAQASISREGAKLLINSWPEFSVIQVADKLTDVLAAVQRHPKAVLLVAGEKLQDICALELLMELKRHRYRPRTLLLSETPCGKLLERLSEFSVLGCVQLSEATERLLQALQAVGSGRNFNLPKHALVAETTPSDPLGPLSNREREIFRLLADGLQNAAIARKLFISPRTVETHRARIVRKLSLASNAELIRYAIRHGISAL